MGQCEGGRASTSFCGLYPVDVACQGVGLEGDTGVFQVCDQRCTLVTVTRRSPRVLPACCWVAMSGPPFVDQPNTETAHRKLRPEERDRNAAEDVTCPG